MKIFSFQGVNRAELQIGDDIVLGLVPNECGGQEWGASGQLQQLCPLTGEVHESLMACQIVLRHEGTSLSSPMKQLGTTECW